jgi:hypothetical protein
VIQFFAPSGGGAAGVEIWRAITTAITRDDTSTTAQPAVIVCDLNTPTTSALGEPTNGEGFLVKHLENGSIVGQLYFNWNLNSGGSGVGTGPEGASSVDVLLSSAYAAGDLVSAILTAEAAGLGGHIALTDLGAGLFQWATANTGAAHEISIAQWAWDGSTGSEQISFGATGLDALPNPGTLSALLKPAVVGKRHIVLEACAVEELGTAWNSGLYFSMSATPGASRLMRSNAIAANSVQSRGMGGIRPGTADEATNATLPAANAPLYVHREAAAGAEQGSITQNVTVTVLGMTVNA